MYLIAAAQKDDIQEVRKTSPELWRQVRRYNLPVQLALAAAEEIASKADDIATAALVSVAPCQAGSPEVFEWAKAIAQAYQEGEVGNLRMNPTHTLHAVDNLALSAFAIMYGNHAHCLGLGGSAGQAWCGLEAIFEHLRHNEISEALLMAGDQEMIEESSSALGIAMICSRQAKPYPPLQRPLKIESMQRQLLSQPVSPKPHSAEGLSQMIAAIHQFQAGTFSYPVPDKHANGTERITITGVLL